WELGGSRLRVLRPPLVAHTAHPDAVPGAIRREPGLGDMGMSDDDVALLPVGTLNHWTVVRNRFPGGIVVAIRRCDDRPDILSELNRGLGVVELVTDIGPFLLGGIEQIQVAVLSELQGR